MSSLAGERQGLALPLAPVGTDFQRSVWTALKAIPYGQTRTYGEIAAAIGRPKAVRAVGQANHHNPLPIFLPCHRVVGSGGTLTGYAGGLEMKKPLLVLESGKERFSTKPREDLKSTARALFYCLVKFLGSLLQQAQRLVHVTTLL